MGSKIKRRIGVAYEYYQAADGTWWTLNAQRGMIRVDPSRSRALRLAIREADAVVAEVAR